MKKTFFIILLSLVLLTLLFVACSDDRVVNTSNPHPVGFGDPGSANFHGDLAACETCHGTQYQTSLTSGSCRRCHENRPSESLISCGTCHHNPPVDDLGLPAGMSIGTRAFGAHGQHVYVRVYVCTECHLQDSDETVAHVDSLPGDLNFSNATLSTARGFQASVTHLGPSNSGNATCAVYCHSNGRGGPPNMPMPEWTAYADNYPIIVCTSCHSIPPPYPHPQVPTCHACHSNVDPSSQYPNNIRFINEQLHVNGVVDL